MDTLQLVDRIPINQAATATPQIKKYLLETIREIRKSRQVIEIEARRQKQIEILDAYKKNVGYDKIEIRIKQLSDELNDLQHKSLELGIDSSNGCLINIDGRDSIYVHNRFVAVTPELRANIKRVRDLLKAVENTVGTFSPMDVLETRMMLASTVGEAMAIVNAVADKDVFKINLGQIMLMENTEEKKKPTKKRASKKRG